MGSCDLYILAGEESEVFFAVHYPNKGDFGNIVSLCIFDFLQPSRSYKQLKEGTFKARSNANNYNFWYQGWDGSERKSINVLGLLAIKLRWPEGPQDPVFDLKTKEGRSGDWSYVIDLEKDEITVADNSKNQQKTWKIGESDIFRD